MAYKHLYPLSYISKHEQNSACQNMSTLLNILLPPCGRQIHSTEMSKESFLLFFFSHTVTALRHGRLHLSCLTLRVTAGDRNT